MNLSPVFQYYSLFLLLRFFRINSLLLNSLLFPQSHLLEEKAVLHYEFWLQLSPHCLLFESEVRATGPPILSNGKKRLSQDNQSQSQILLITLFCSLCFGRGWSTQWLNNSSLGSEYHCFWKKDLHTL